MSTARPICAAFEGNFDIYGLGIRTGIYRQWFSSCLCMMLYPESAQELHAANSIFVFAIVNSYYYSYSSHDYLERGSLQTGRSLHSHPNMLRLPFDRP